MKDQSIDPPTVINVATRPPPVVIRRKQIPIEVKRQNSSIAESSISDEGPRSSREKLDNIAGRKRKDRGHSRGEESRFKENARCGFELENDGACALSEVESHSRKKRYFLAKSTSTNGTARRLVSTEIGGGRTTSISSSSYEHDLQSLLHSQLRENITGYKCRKEAGTSTGTSGRFAIKISDSTSSDLQEESELSSEERDALIENIRTTSNVCCNKIPKFSARRRVVTTTRSSVVKDYYPRTAENRLLDLNKDSCCATTTATTLTRHNVHVINENVHVINETDTFHDDFANSSQKPTSAPNTLSLGRKLSSWKKEGKDLLVKSVSSANTLTPTTMTCIKSPGAMSEHLLEQFEVPVAPATAVLSALRVKGGSLRESDRSERMIDVPRQRWSSVKDKGGSVKSLLLENGGPQQQPLKDALRKEVFCGILRK